MENKPFKEPNIKLDRIYTKQGDGGETRLAGGQRVSKDSLRMECCGTVDELNALIGMARLSAGELAKRSPRLDDLNLVLGRIQQELFSVGSVLARKEGDVQPGRPCVGPNEVEELERDIDSRNGSLAPLRSFVLPGGNRLNVELHLCRTVCRRAERRVVALAREEEISPEVIRYLNRLSDAFFVWSRWVNLVLGDAEVLWEPNQPAP